MSYPPDNLNWDRLKTDVRRAADCVELYPRLHPDPAGDVRDGGSVRCIAPDHEDSDPSMSLYEDGFKCHACGASGDVFDMWALAYGRSTDGEDFKQTLVDLAGNSGLNLKDYARNGDTVDVEQPPAPEPPSRSVPSSTENAAGAPTTEPPEIRRKVFRRIWDLVRPLDLTNEARTWLESRDIPPFVAQGYGCRDWHPVIGDVFDVLRDYSSDELRTAGILNDDGDAWWPLRTFLDDDRETCRGLCVPVWHPDHPEAPIAVRWRVYQPGEDFPPKAFQQPTGPGPFRQPPLGLCEPPPAMQVMLGAPWLEKIDPDTLRDWLDDDQFRPVGAYPGDYAVVLCEGETDWLSVAAAALELETETRIVPVAKTSMGSSWPERWTQLIEGGEQFVAMFDGDNHDPDCKGRQRADEVYAQLVAQHPRGTDGIDDRFIYRLQPEGDDLNERRTAGDLVDYLHVNALE